MFMSQNNQLCCLCRKSNLYWKDVPEIPHSVILCCRKYLSPELIGNFLWQENVNESEHFCGKCHNDTERLFQLNSQLELIHREIADHVNQMTQFIIGETTLSGQENILQPITISDIVNRKNLRHGEEQTGESNNVITEINPIEEQLEDCDVNVNCNDDDSFSNCDTTKEISPFIVYTDFDDIAEQKTKKTRRNSRNSFKNDTQNKSKDLDEAGTISDDRPVQTGEEGEDSRTRKKIIGSNELQTHLSNPNKGFECSTCLKRFAKLSILQSHNCEKRTEECKICGKSFSTAFVLKLHMRSHTGEQPYKCETCGKCFSIKANLRRHTRTHTGEKPFKCEFCGKDFSDETCFVRHKQTHRDKDRNITVREYKCDVCSKVLYDLGNLKSHLRIHTEKTNKCDICGRTFYTVERLEKHKSTHADKTCVCEVCGKTVSNWVVLRDHMLVHESKKPFQCAQCDRSFRRQHDLNMHMTTHAVDETYVCETCGKTYSSSYAIKMHRRTHRTNNCMCDSCGRIFRTNQLLTKHKLQAHTKERPFKCGTCEKSFKLAELLRRHTIRMQGRCDKKFWNKCKICNEEFQAENAFRKHQRKLHSTPVKRGKRKCAQKSWELQTVKTEPDDYTSDEESQYDSDKNSSDNLDHSPQGSSHEDSHSDDDAAEIKEEQHSPGSF